MIIAHRGASVAAPENTLAAFRLAIQQGADGIELDVHATADGHLIVMHNATVDRTTDGEGAIAELTLAEIKRLDAGRWFAPDFAGERVPLLEEVLEVARGHLLVDIEVKVAGIEAEVVDMVKRFDMVNAVLLTSFFPQVLTAAQALAPEIPGGLLQLHGEVDEALRLRVPVLLPLLTSLSRAMIDTSRQHGMAVIPWTARTEGEIQQALHHAVHGIIVDDPLMVQRLTAKPE